LCYSEANKIEKEKYDAHKKKHRDPDDPKPLNFDHDEERGPAII